MRSLFLSCVAALLFSCGPREDPRQDFDPARLIGNTPIDTNPRDGGTFIWGRSSDAIKLDPGTVSDGESVMVTTNIFDNLVTFAPGSTDIVPCLATSWETPADGLVWTFQLRDDVTFHDGTPFNAAAVVFTFERQMKEDHPGRKPGDSFGTFQSYFKALAKVEAVEEHVVRFTLSRPYAAFLNILACYCVGIVSPAAFHRDVEFWRNPVGTGPFVFKEWRSDVRIVLKANKSYWGGAPHIDQLIFRPIKNPQARLKELEAGGIHGMDNPDLLDLPVVARDGKLRVVSKAGINVCYLAMHTQKAPFTNVKVRQAVQFAVNKKRILEVAYNGMAVEATTMCPVTLWGHLEKPDRRVNLVRARKLLKEAGYENGFKTTLWYSAAARTYLPNPGDTAIQIQQDLKAIGILVELKKLDWNAYIAAVQAGKHDMCLIGWMADIADPDGFLYILLDKTNARIGSSDNLSFYQGERVHNLLLQAQAALDQSLRAKLYRQVQQLILDEVPVLPLATVRDYRILARNVRGYTIYPAGGEYFKNVSFAK